MVKFNPNSRFDLFGCEVVAVGGLHVVNGELLLKLLLAPLRPVRTLQNNFFLHMNCTIKLYRLISFKTASCAAAPRQNPSKQFCFYLYNIAAWPLASSGFAAIECFRASPYYDMYIIKNNFFFGYN